MFMLVLALKRNPGLRYVHHVLAVLISLALVLTPLSSPVATAAALESAHGMASANTEDAAGAMSDCEKMMAPAKSKPCACCDRPAKAPCPDAIACLLKCGMHVLAVLVPSRESDVPVPEHHWPVKPEKPPDWALRPPIPPPRV
jgi:hypothetical protein